MISIGTDGHPVETIIGRPFTNFIRLLIHTRKIEPDSYAREKASAARLKASVLMALEIIVLTASREEVIAAWLEMARPSHPELTDRQILDVLEEAIPHTTSVRRIGVLGWAALGSKLRK